MRLLMLYFKKKISVWTVEAHKPLVFGSQNAKIGDFSDILKLVNYCLNLTTAAEKSGEGQSAVKGFYWSKVRCTWPRVATAQNHHLSRPRASPMLMIEGWFMSCFESERLDQVVLPLRLELFTFTFRWSPKRINQISLPWLFFTCKGGCMHACMVDVKS